MEVIVKKLLSAITVVLFLAVLSSCGSADASDADTGQLDYQKSAGDSQESEEVPAEDRPVAYLELCYATSINMPEDLYGPGNVFDNDVDNCWATMPGAAPDEGLYFSFEEPIDIYSIELEAVPGDSAYGEISSCQLYINGVEGAARLLGSGSTYIDSPVKSVFVKIYSTESIAWDDEGIRYQRDLPVGISEVTLFVMNNEGDEVPLQIVPIGTVGGFVEASSSLEPVESYCPDFLFDSRPAFGWADGNDNRTGEGESLTFFFDEPQRIEKIKIWNGYHRSGEHFDQNERAALITFGPEGGPSSEYNLEDIMDPQVITLETPLEGSSFTMDILEIYPGETYRDLVISELRFFDGEEWFIIDSGESEIRKLAILEWAQNTDAGTFIDRQIYSNASKSYYYNRQSIVIRSNGSFVIWKEDERTDSRERMYADGNWQILDENTIRIFGRMHRLASYEQGIYDPYAGTWSDEDERLNRMTIFSDTLRFGEDWLSSSRGIFEDFSF